MKLKDNRNEDELEVLVDDDLISFPSLCLAAIIVLSGIGLYQSISEEVSKHGSLKNAYNYQMELLNKAPLNGLYP